MCYFKIPYISKNNPSFDHCYCRTVNWLPVVDDDLQWLWPSLTLRVPLNVSKVVISCNCLLHFAWVVDNAKCIVVMRVCLCVSVCLSASVRPHYCMDPDVTWVRGRGCSIVVHYWADLQSGHGLRCYGNIMRTLVTSLRPSCDMTT